MTERLTRSRRVHLGFVALSFAAATIGAVFEPGQWYADRSKPPWTPPDWIFGPVWSLLYACMGIAAARVRLRTRDLLPMLLWLGQLGLNAAWSWLFFGLHRPDLAFYEIQLLWIAIVLTTLSFRRFDGPAAALLVPYLAWVSFASWLNWWLWKLNP
jgi:tryptophan-rich sensory protein